MTSTRTSAAEKLGDLADLLREVEGFREVNQALKLGHSGTVDGAWGSSAALAAATLLPAAGRTLLVVIAHPRDLDAWSLDLSSFSGLRPLIFPAWDNLPGDREGADETAGQRLRILKQLESSNPPRLLLATFQAML